MEQTDIGLSTASDNKQNGSEVLAIYKDISSLYQEYQLELKNFIKSKPLYIMFEDQLGCDAKTDHLYPKDVSPLFIPKLGKLELLFQANLYSILSQHLSKQGLSDGNYPVDYTKLYILEMQCEILQQEYKKLQNDFQQYIISTTKTVQQNQQVIRDQQYQLKFTSQSILYQADTGYSFKNIQRILADVADKIARGYSSEKYLDSELNAITMDKQTQCEVKTYEEAEIQTEGDLEKQLISLRLEVQRLNEQTKLQIQQQAEEANNIADQLRQQIAQKDELIGYLNTRVEKMESDQFSKSDKKVFSSIISNTSQKPKPKIVEKEVQTVDLQNQQSNEGKTFDLASFIQRNRGGQIQNAKKQKNPPGMSWNNVQQVQSKENSSSHLTTKQSKLLVINKQKEDEQQNKSEQPNSEKLTTEQLKTEQQSSGQQKSKQKDIKGKVPNNSLNMLEQSPPQALNSINSGSRLVSSSMNSAPQSTESKFISSAGRSAITSQQTGIFSATNPTNIINSQDNRKQIQNNNKTPYNDVQTKHQTITNLQQPGKNQETLEKQNHSPTQNQQLDQVISVLKENPNIKVDGNGFIYTPDGKLVGHASNYVSMLQEGSQEDKLQLLNALKQNVFQNNSYQETTQHNIKGFSPYHKGFMPSIGNNDDTESSNTHDDGYNSPTNNKIQISKHPQFNSIPIQPIDQNEQDDKQLSASIVDEDDDVVFLVGDMQMTLNRTTNSVNNTRLESKQGVKYVKDQNGVNRVLVNAKNIVYDEKLNKYYEVDDNGKRIELTMQDLQQLVDEQRNNIDIIDRIEQFLSLYNGNKQNDVLLGPNVTDGNYIIVNGKKLFNKQTQTDITYINDRKHKIQQVNSRFFKYERIIDTKVAHPSVLQPSQGQRQHGVQLYTDRNRPENHMSDSRTNGFYLKQKASLQQKVMTKDHKIKKIFVVDMSNMLKGM